MIGYRQKSDLIHIHRKSITEILDRIRSMEELDIDDTSLIEGIIFEVLGFALPTEQYHLISEIVREHLFGGYGVIKPLLEDSDINEIMINGPENIFIERYSCTERYPNCFLSEQELEDLIRKFASDVHREINETNPIVDARTKEGFRVNGVLKNISINGPTLTIRKFKKDIIDFSELIRSGSIIPEVGHLLTDLMYSGYNIFISGGTSSGKTTLLNALCSMGAIRHNRVIVIEDSAELIINDVENIVRFECKNANALGLGEVNMSDLIKSSLRMRPDRIIVGEVRGKEVVDMIQAMNTGHDGSLSTGHANSIAGMLARLETMYMMGSNTPINAIRSQISFAIEIMIHMKRTPQGERKISEVAELTGIDSNGNYELNYLFISDDEGNVVSTGNRLLNRSKLVEPPFYYKECAGVES